MRTESPLFVSDELMESEGIILALEHAKTTRRTRRTSWSASSASSSTRSGRRTSRRDTAPRWALAVVAGAGLLVAACSDDDTPAPASTTHDDPPTTTTTTAATSTSTSTSTTVGPDDVDHSSSARRVACSHLTASAGQAQGAAGTITGIITLTNTGPATCTVNGYPTMALFSGSGAPLTVTMVNGLTVNLSPAANAPPSAGHGGAGSATAQFAYQYSDVPVGIGDELPDLGDGERDRCPGRDRSVRPRSGWRSPRATTGRSACRRSTPDA